MILCSRSQDNINVAVPADNMSVVSDEGLELSVLLKRGGAGFGFRIVGGAEEDTQVTSNTKLAVVSRPEYNFWSSPDTMSGNKGNWPDKTIFPSDTDVSVLGKHAIGEPTL